MPREERITDRHHQTLGYIYRRDNGEVVVYDKHHRILGYVNEYGTWTAHRKRVSYQKVVGLLLPTQE